MFEQICQQRESMNLGMGGAAAQADDDDVWITKEIQFAKPNEAASSKESDDMFGMFKKDSHLPGTTRSGSSSSSGSSTDDDDNDAFKMTPNK